MSLPLPTPAIHAPFLKEVRTVHQGDYYTAEQMQAYREQALEEAANVCDAHADGHNYATFCAEQIRNLK